MIDDKNNYIKFVIIYKEQNTVMIKYEQKEIAEKNNS